MNKHGLKRLILINTHIKGRAVEIRLDGHANLSGENGAGKTSLLKLIAFFYGSEPSKLCPRVENKKSFVDYFLPTDKSYLVYEYQTEMGMQCVVVYRHGSGIKPAYRFLPGGFVPSVFYALSPDGKSKAFSNDELKRNCHSHSITVSRQIETVQDYRAVLMNQRSVLDRSDDPSELKRLIPLYSLSPRRPLFHLEKISEAALSSEGSLERIKQIVANIMAEDGVPIAKINIDKDSHNLVEEITALREIERETPKLDQMVSDAIALTGTRNAIACCHGELKHWETSLKAAIDSKRGERNQLLQKKDVLDAAWQSTRSGYDSRISQLDITIGTGEQEIQSISEKRIAFEDNGIYDKKSKVQQIPQIESLSIQAEERLQDLQRKDRDAQNQFLADQSKLEYWRTNRNQELQSEVDQITEKASALVERENDAKSATQKRFSEKREELGLRFREEQLSLSDKLTEARSQARQSFQTEEEKLQIAAAETLLEDRQLALQSVLTAREKAQKSRDARQHDFEKAQGSRRHAHDTLDAANECLSVITGWLNPESGTLREALVRHGEPWTQTAAKVLQPALLDRKDLKPGWLGGAQSLYGWALNLDAIDVPAYARSIEDIIRQRDEQASIVEVAKQRLAVADEAQVKAEEELRDAQNDWQEQDRLVIAAQSLVIGAKDALKSEKHKVSEAQERRRAEARKEEARLEVALDNLKQRERKAREGLDEDEKDALREGAGTFASEHDEIRHAREALKAQREELARLYREKYKRLESDKQERLSKQGISADTLEKAEKECDSYRRQLETYRGYREEVYRFEAFCQNDWPRLVGLQVKVQNEKEQRRKAEGERDTAQARYEESCEAHRKMDIGLGREIKAINDQIGTVDSHLSRLRNERSTPPGESPVRPLDLLELDLGEALRLRGDQERSIVSGIRNAENILTRRQRSPLYEAWAQSCREIDPGGSDIDQAMQKATALERMLRSGVRQVRETLLQQIRLTGVGLANLHGAMESVQKAVDRESRRISASIKELATAEALQNIELRLISRIEKLDYWPQLKRFHGLWEEWRKMDDTLPSPEFEGALGATLKELLLSRKETSVESLFEIQLQVTENGNPATISTDRSMNAVSSTGLSLMFIFTVYAGITRLYCNKSDLAVHWPVDELARLDPRNAGRLVELMDSCGVIMVGGFPSTDESLTRIFVNKHIVDHEKGIVHFKLSDNPIERALHEREQAQRETT